MRLLKLTMTGLVAAFMIFAAGFVAFGEYVAHLSPPETANRADGIIVLTGGHQRIQVAVDLLRDQRGERLLISGVNPAATKAELQVANGAEKSLFSCCVDLDTKALDTIGNASESAKWIHQKGYRSVYVVTNNYHMPRSLMELRRYADDVEFVAWPVNGNGDEQQHWLVRPGAIRVLLTEYTKYVAAMARGAFTGPENVQGASHPRAALN